MATLKYALTCIIRCHCFIMCTTGSNTDNSSAAPTPLDHEGFNMETFVRTDHKQVFRPEYAMTNMVIENEDYGETISRIFEIWVDSHNAGLSFEETKDKIKALGGHQVSKDDVASNMQAGSFT